MTVELINTGSELLLGSVLNTHVRFLAEALFPLGLRIARQVAVPDGEPIREALAESFTRAGIVLVTGGLGPTTDDITREITAELLGLELVHDEEIMRAITERFVRRGLTIGERVGRQAQRPREATVLVNHHGTAPGLYLRGAWCVERGAWVGVDPQSLDAPRSTLHVFLLPGPTRELHTMVRDEVLPNLRALVPAKAEFGIRTWHIAGLGESHVEELVGEALLGLGVELGYCARPGEVDLRTIGAEEQLAAAERIVMEKLAPHIVSADGRALEKVVVDLLAARGEKLATAESCTGGFLANRVTNVPGASAVFTDGFVTYANEAKTRALGVDAALIAEHGAVSQPVAAAMAAGALRVSGADYALATTGIAGPGGGSEEKPVGTVFIALASRRGASTVEQHRFPTDRENFKHLTTQTALNLLRRALAETAPA